MLVYTIGLISNRFQTHINSRLTNCVCKYNFIPVKLQLLFAYFIQYLDTISFHILILYSLVKYNVTAIITLIFIRLKFKRKFSSGNLTRNFHFLS